MLDSVWKRWVLAAGLAALVAVGITAVLSRPSHRAKEKRVDAVAEWKTRTGVDLTALPRLFPPRPDSEAARGLDAILQPGGLRLGARSPGPRPPRPVSPDAPAFEALRDALRAEVRFDTPQVKPFPPAVVSILERSGPVLDAVAAHVESHEDIRWYEDFGPRPRPSTLDLDDHLTVHRLLIGRAYLALERGDIETARRMLSASRRLNEVLARRRELTSQFVAVGVERLQLALLRRGGDVLGVHVDDPRHELRERYVAAMSAEAAVVLANSRDPLRAGGDPGDRAFRAIAGGSLELAASEAVIAVAKAVAEIAAASDACAELARERRVPGSFFSGNFFTLDATEAWRRFVVLALDRAITAAALTGRAASPCPSVSITVREDGAMRVVESSGLPSPSDNVIRLPERVSVPLKPKGASVDVDRGSASGRPPAPE